MGTDAMLNQLRTCKRKSNSVETGILIVVALVAYTVTVDPETVEDNIENSVQKTIRFISRVMELPVVSVTNTRISGE